jgi:RHS repeat-associated protein
MDPTQLPTKSGATALPPNPANAGGSTNSSQPADHGAPAINLPKGGGAIRGIGEKFDVNTATGSASAQVPLPITPGRDGHGPSKLALNYSSDGGNGPWGLGWRSGYGSITRKTDKGIPRYDETDIFMFEGAEDLVPRFRTDDEGVLLSDNYGSFILHEDILNGWTIRRYSPRIEGQFLRIERWASQEDQTDVHWKVFNPDNSVTVLGLNDDSRIFDSSGPGKRIFSWLPSYTFDSKGNCSLSTYKREDSTGVDTISSCEINRDSQSRSSNVYLKSIKYGNRTPNRDLSTWEPFHPKELPDSAWMYELVFDYGEHDTLKPTVGDSNPWLCRQDPFSVYRSSFDIRTYRLCRRVLMFHHFPVELGVQDYLVSSTVFTYDENSIGTVMISTIRFGHVLESGVYVNQSLPPVEFEYSKLPTPDELNSFSVRKLDTNSEEGLPSGFTGSYQNIDMEGTGLSGILFEDNGAWYYKRNTSANNIVQNDDARDDPVAVARFDLPVVLPLKPNATFSGSFQALSLTGDGEQDIVLVEPASGGYYERSHTINPTEGGSMAVKAGWQDFKSFHSFPNVMLDDPNTRLVDLSGDGLADILVSEDDKFVWYESKGSLGFFPARLVAQSNDEEKGPRLVFSDPEHSIYLVDMSGDGLSDLVRISRGNVCYWPNLGYGRFGSKITMNNSLLLDSPDQFDNKRIRLVDIDGSGTTDILYLASDHVKIFRNHSGNGWSEPQLLTNVPPFDSITSVQTFDLLGSGTACLVWSSGKPADARAPVYYLDLMNGVKPHLLVRGRNNMGAETRYTYKPSTQFYLDDDASGTPWVTRLPFPVQCVAKKESYDYISRARFVSRYAYHNGYYDGWEREFRGFAAAEQWDTEEFQSLGIQTSDDVSNWTGAYIAPPIHVKQWYHTGAFIEGEELAKHLAAGYFGAPSPFEEDAFADFIESQNLKNAFPDSLRPDDIREALRSLKGLTLREEVYTDDGGELASLPYSITSKSYSTVCLQPRDLQNQHSIWRLHPRESITYQYERSVADPRILHSIQLRQDRFGNDLKSMTIAYGRRESKLQGIQKAIQEQMYVSYTEQTFSDFIDNPATYRLPAASERKGYELAGLAVPLGRTLFRYSDFADDNLSILTNLPEVPAETPHGPASSWKRLMSRSRTFYRSDDLSQLLPAGKIESMLHSGQSYTLVYTPGMIAKFQLGSNNLLSDQAALLTQGGFVDFDHDSHWWAPSPRTYYHLDPAATPQQELAEGRSHVFYGRRFVDIFGNVSTITQDVHNLLPIQSTDAVGNITTAMNNYRVIQPYQSTDPNGNRKQVSFDALGKVVGSAVMGKITENVGDNLDGFSPNITDQDIASFFSDPKGLNAPRLLGNASTRIIYDNNRFSGDPSKRLPAWSAVIARETHVSDLSPGAATKIRVNFSYSDGYGREIQQKNMCEAGPLTEGTAVIANRWVGTGWSIFNNKGKEVQKFEPFFDDTHEFKFDKRVGASPIILYDPSSRPAATVRPDHSWSKTVSGAWKQLVYDAGDTVAISDPRQDPDVGPLFQALDTHNYLPTWYNARKDGAMGVSEQATAQKSSAYADTPTVSHADALGRPFVNIMDNGAAGKYSEVSLFDIEGHKLGMIDPLGRTVERLDYNMTGQSYHHTSMDSGDHWILNDAAGTTFLVWNGRGQRLRTSYDPARRAIGHYLQEPGTTVELLVDRTVYGESQDNAEASNLRGHMVKQYDQSGRLEHVSYDFKGNLMAQEQRFAVEYKQNIDWTNIDQIAMEPEVYRNETRFDALNRRTRGKTPDNTVTINVYNEASYVEKIRVNIRGELDANSQPVFQEYVTTVDYDAQGRRTLIQYGNGSKTTFSYDPLTTNLTNLRTSTAKDTVQDNSYTYDIVGNVSHIDDISQQATFFQNQRINPSMDYTFDSLSRLIEARGRERLDSNGNSIVPTPSGIDSSSLPNAAPNAMGRYVETYVYDSGNNILSMKHQGSTAQQPGWTRTYNYQSPSQLEPTKASNKLTSTIAGGVTETYRYDGPEGATGLLTGMSHLSSMRWNFKDELASTATQNVNAGAPETTYYVYDAGGQRVRKVTERSTSGNTNDPPRKAKECLYLTGLDIFRKYAGDGTTIALERQIFKAVHTDKVVALVETRTVSTAAPGTPLPPARLIRYQYGNFLGSIALELDDQGGVLSYEEYSPYGHTTYRALANQVDAPSRYRFAGKERDKETGLYCYGKRYYAAWIGRWISADPGGTADGTNVFCYVRCNPVRYKDSGGTDSVDWRASLNVFQRAALAADDWVNEHPVVKGVVDNLDKRGEALMNTPKALAELAQKPAGEIVTTLAKGTVQLVKDTGKAAVDIGYYGAKAVTEGGDENWQKVGSAATDLVLNTADIVSKCI